jgi:hypothetical protein
MNKEDFEDPFIIVKDHRSKQVRERLCLRVLDINTVGNRVPQSVNLVRKPYIYEDK